MCSPAPALLPERDDTPPAELVALFTGEELYAAARETSPRYNGLVLAHAVVIVQRRVGMKSILALQRKLGVARNTIYRWVHAAPITTNIFERAMRELAFLLCEN